MRECLRVLKPDGRLAMLTIETTEGLHEPDQALAAELGPAAVRAAAPAQELVRRAGFQVRHVEDVTEAFGVTCSAMADARRSAEAALRAAEGDEAYEMEQAKKEHMLEGIRLGLLRRSLVVAEKA